MLRSYPTLRLLLLLLVSGASLLPLHAQTGKGEITLESLWLYYQYYPSYPSEFRWMKDDRYYSVLEDGKGIARYAVEGEQKVDMILEFSTLQLGDLAADAIEGYTFSADERQVLLEADIEPIYRRSQRAQVAVAAVGGGQARLLHGGRKISNATLSPDGSKVVFVSDNNIYYTDLATGQETAVTTDGVMNQIINGITDWVYEEEFAFVDAVKWSPDGQYLAYYRFDESQVNQFSMDIYGSLYPIDQTFKYPKAGEANALVSIHIYDLAGRSTVQADLGSETDQYVPRIAWTHQPGELAVLRMNRLQNHADLLVADARTGSTRTWLSESSETYLREPTDDMWHFLADGSLLWLSEQDGYRHIYRYDAQGQRVKQLTTGAYDVEEVLGVDETGERIYYLSTEASPLERQLYSVGLDGKKKKRLTEAEGQHEVTVSPGFRYFVDSHSSHTQVPMTRLCDIGGKAIKTLEDNERLAKRVAALDIAAPSFFEVENAAGVSLNGWMIKPHNFDPTRKYPVLMFVYGGPGSQEVLDAWGHGDPFNYIWHQMLAQRGYIVACVDSRGTGGRGRDFRAATYADLGKLETQDQLDAARWLAAQPYVDPARLGIWGWSYGGYMTALCLTKGGGLFKAGIAVAPVTNWRFYDTIYTERYLKTPQLNPDGYDDNSPINFAGDLSGSLLLVHGMADDNVHMQNSVEFIDALVASNKQFDMFFYPNRNHGIYGGTTRYHLYKQMTDFVLEKL
ncbi:MAG: S9 family peptidase [Bacteroidia bacterium]